MAPPMGVALPGVGALPGGLDPNVLRAVQEATARAALLGNAAAGGVVPGTATPAPAALGRPGVLQGASAGAASLPGAPLAPKVPLGSFLGGAGGLPGGLPGLPGPTAGLGLPLGLGGGGPVAAPSVSALSEISSQIALSLAKLRAVKDATKVAKASGPEVANPYLAHRATAAAAAAAASTAAAAGAPPATAGGEEDEAAPLPVGVDPRLKVTSARNRGKRAFKFIEEGSIVKEAEHQREKEALRNLIAMTRGPGSRRKPTKHMEGATEGGEEGGDGDANPNLVKVQGLGVKVPPRPAADRVVPDVEWWDSAFLPADKRKARAAAGGRAPLHGPFTMV